jgi:hypothetical protein
MNGSIILADVAERTAVLAIGPLQLHEADDALQELRVALPAMRTVEPDLM